MLRSRLPLIIAAVVAVVALGSVLVVQRFLAGDSVPALSLSPTSAPGSSMAAFPSADPAPSEVAIAPTPTGVAGTWTIGSGSLVGYRVREQLGGVSAQSDAVGRTSAITGSVTIVANGTGIRVSAASFTADLSQLTSDDGRRDNRLQTMGVETARFPTATFNLTSPIDAGAAALTGVTTDVQMSGNLTIHGVTKSVTIAGQARLNGNRIEIVASLTFPFSDYGMTPPSIGGFVEVQNNATLEVLVSLAKVAA